MLSFRFAHDEYFRTSGWPMSYGNPFEWLSRCLRRARIPMISTLSRREFRARNNTVDLSQQLMIGGAYLRVIGPLTSSKMGFPMGFSAPSPPALPLAMAPISTLESAEVSSPSKPRRTLWFFRSGIISRTSSSSPTKPFSTNCITDTDIASFV